MSTSASYRLAAFAMVAILAAAPRPARPDSQPDFGGLWLLDTKESETLQQKMEAMRQSGGMPGPPAGGGWHGGGMGGGPPMGGGMGGHHEGGAGHDSTRARMMNDLAHPPMSLVIDPGSDAYVLSERGRTLEVLVISDDPTAGSSIEPDAPHAQARWKGKHLIAERNGPRGTITQEYELASDGKKLTVHTRLEARDGRPPLELKRVYDRSEGDQEPPAAAAAEPMPLSPTAPDSTRR